ncbi:hypothetical protein C0Q70_12981 [Pomacea canaliculata]|uniref:Uncharacterized protein n=1 Tax=Pomacea canaliculata TaxID=400727 RepID=A0A2T7P302_POMCA|nr:hypothetical protein C0Q70_12981 [Pomacea canaliculata]
MDLSRSFYITNMPISCTVGISFAGRMAPRRGPDMARGPNEEQSSEGLLATRPSEINQRKHDIAV